MLKAEQLVVGKGLLKKYIAKKLVSKHFGVWYLDTCASSVFGSRVYTRSFPLATISRLSKWLPVSKKRRQFARFVNVFEAVPNEEGTSAMMFAHLSIIVFCLFSPTYSMTKNEKVELRWVDSLKMSTILNACCNCLLTICLQSFRVKFNFFLIAT